VDEDQSQQCSVLRRAVDLTLLRLFGEVLPQYLRRAIGQQAGLSEFKGISLLEDVEY